MSKRFPDTPALYDHPLALAAQFSGGVLIGAQIKPLPVGQNGGCGSPTHVIGTNGGTMPCGALLTQFGVTAPHYCPHCEKELAAHE